MLRLDNDIKSMQNFANRAYTNELSMQKTVLRDLLGGESDTRTARTQYIFLLISLSVH